MKGEQAEYIIPLRDAFKFPKPKRIIKTLGVIRRFAFKHTRKRDVFIAREVNEFLHLHSKNIPRRVDAVIVLEGEKARIFLREGKELAEFRKSQADKKKAKDKKKDEKASKEDKEGKKAEKDEEKELERKREEKKIKEDAAMKSDIKRKTGRK